MPRLDRDGRLATPRHEQSLDVSPPRSVRLLLRCSPQRVREAAMMSGDAPAPNRAPRQHGRRGVEYRLRSPLRATRDLRLVSSWRRRQRRDWKNGTAHPRIAWEIFYTGRIKRVHSVHLCGAMPCKSQTETMSLLFVAPVPCRTSIFPQRWRNRHCTLKGGTEVLKRSRMR
jgi:hypothetical protein